MNEECKEEFLKLLSQHETIIVTGPTGCGKSTCIPSWIALANPGCKVLMT